MASSDAKVMDHLAVSLFPNRGSSVRSRLGSYFAGVAGLALLAFLGSVTLLPKTHHFNQRPLNAVEILAECADLQTVPLSTGLHSLRTHSERHHVGTPPQWIRNATIWTGRKKGEDVVYGDVLLKDGLIQGIGKIPKRVLDAAGKDLVQYDAKGAWLTPGIFDLHSHLAVASVPDLKGTDDANSFKGLTLPWLKVLDGFNVYDEAMPQSVSGGVTTALILPGSADAIGGQAFVVKLRPTAEGSPTSRVLEPPFAFNGTNPTDPPHWRHMKHATGENPVRVYGGTRMDTMWAFREAYNEARKVKEAQDDYCARAIAGLWPGLGHAIPKDIKWEALVDVLRGKVKVNIHSYSPSDLDGLVRLSHEFKFHIAAIHHAHSAYLVTPLLEKFYGGKPAVAMFATNARYKQEAYRGSEFAPKILHDAGFDVVMKSDHPVLNSRYLIYEAAQAHLYGLPAAAAIRSVTTVPAAVAGFGHRLGYVQPGYDADVVVWDSHPLTLGATPKQVWIDGIPQLAKPAPLTKSKGLQKEPKMPSWDTEAKQAIEYEGLPPLKGDRTSSVAFINVKSTWSRDPSGGLVELSMGDQGVMHFVDGSLACSSPACPSTFSDEPRIVDLEGGSMGPGLISFGSPLGVEEIEQEPSTRDGYAYGPFDKEFTIVGDLARAADGLAFEGRSMLLAYRNGVVASVSAPKSRSLISGLSVAFSNAAGHSLEQGAIISDVAALHVNLSPDGQPSVSTQIGLLRQILLSPDDSKVTRWFRMAAKGELPSIVHVHSADIIARLLTLKKEVEAASGGAMRISLHGGLESHLVAKELAAADVGVIISPVHSFPFAWEARRADLLPGPPLSEDTIISKLLSYNVTVGLGVLEGWDARNLRFDAAWTHLDGNGKITREQAVAMASTNLERMLGLSSGEMRGEWVAYRNGGVLDFTSKVVGVVSERRGVVELF